TEGVSPGTINRELNPIRHMFKIARSEWGIPLEPFKDWKALYEGPGREWVLKREDETKLYEAVKAQCRTQLLLFRWLSLIVMATSTALRRGVLLNLTWGDLDWDRKVLTIKRTYWSGKKKAPPEVPVTIFLFLFLTIYNHLVPVEDKLPTSRI